VTKRSSGTGRLYVVVDRGGRAGTARRGVQQELGELFTALVGSFSECTSYSLELHALDVVGDVAYTAGLEHTSVSVDGQPRTYSLRATQVDWGEDGEWKVAHRHGDTAAD